MKEIIYNKVKFTSFNDKEFAKIIKKNGLFLFPSGPGLSDLKNSKKYHQSLMEADFNCFDSGLFVLLLRLFKGIRVNKFSGYKFLNFFFNHINQNKINKLLSIDPDNKISNINYTYLNKFKINKVYNYVAPIYNPDNLNDKKLIQKINLIKPNIILVNIGGGIQEILGLYIRNNLTYKAKIICTGAAISFFTGQQAPINNLIDKLYLGWLFRIIFNPIIFLPRYIFSFKLALHVLKTNIDLDK